MKFMPFLLFLLMCPLPLLAHPLSEPLIRVCKSIGNLTTKAEKDCFAKSIRTLDTYQSILASIKRSPEKASSERNLSLLKSTLEDEKFFLPDTTYQFLAKAEQAIRTARLEPNSKQKVILIIESLNKKLDLVHDDLSNMSKNRGLK